MIGLRNENLLQGPLDRSSDVRLHFARAIKYSLALQQHQSKELQPCQGCLPPALSWPEPTNLFEVLAPSVMACHQRRREMHNHQKILDYVVDARK